MTPNNTQNALRLAVINVIGDVMLFLGKVAVAATCGVIAFAMSTLPYYTNPTMYPDTYISSPVLPIAISIITGYIVAELFFAVYEMAIDTIMLSFCEDCEAHNDRPQFAPPLLAEIMGEPGAKQADSKDQQQQGGKSGEQQVGIGRNRMEPMKG
jgi:solute carrier family 44 (choline transporter-like protein), member 2/4/5